MIEAFNGQQIVRVTDANGTSEHVVVIDSYSYLDAMYQACELGYWIVEENWNGTITNWFTYTGKGYNKFKQIKTRPRP